MKKIICFFKGHKRGNTWYLPWKKAWMVKCKKCSYKIIYESPMARLVGTEMKFGFDGE